MSDSKRHRAALAGLIDNPGRYLDADDVAIRRTAVAATRNHPELWDELARMLMADSTPSVRRECAEVLGLTGSADPAVLAAALADDVAEVREAIITALGEIASPSSVPQLLRHATDTDEDSLVREAAVAALGSIGDGAAVPALLELLASGPPQVRRRCVAALSVFDGAAVDSALLAAAEDRNPMVREAAEMVVGRAVD